ncbi:MAG TPA: shikimate dehydrogenase [Aldersonia sp.]
MSGEVIGDVRRAAVLGSPVEHSRSPQLHLAAYRALGLDGWTYERIECTAEQLPGFVRSRGPEWAGLSVTMPGKVAALDVADSQSDRALLCGSANTLVHTSQGWHADCTDIDGVRGALLQGGVANLEGASVVVLGAGGTARPAVYALAELGVAKITIVARDANRARTAIELSATLGMPARVIDLDERLVAEACAASLAVVNTMPASAAAELSGSVSEAPFVLDAIYDPWPTPLASAVTAAGGTVVSGLLMLLNQAYGQVEQFTGLPAPREAMAEALLG